MRLNIGFNTEKGGEGGGGRVAFQALNKADFGWLSDE